MAEKLDPKEIVSFKELLMANSMQVDVGFVIHPPGKKLTRISNL
jgi:hypothetical protein